MSISELYCLEPECPPVETVITARTPDGLVKDWRVAKSINDVKAIDVKGLIEEKSSNGIEGNLFLDEKNKSPCIDICEFSGPNGWCLDAVALATNATDGKNETL